MKFKIQRQVIAAKLVTASALAACAAGAIAAPYVPADDARVLERIAPAIGKPVATSVAPTAALIPGLKAMRAKLARDPGNLELALQLAQRYIAAARSSADPRFLGYAEGTLAPWLRRAPPPAPALVLRATLRQSNHDFAGALADLDAALAIAPRDAQSWLTRATVLGVQAKYRDAAQSCARLAPLAGELVTVACLAQVGSLAGQADEAYAALNAALARENAAEARIKAKAPGANRAWAHSLLAEIAVRMGRDKEAQAHFAQALATDGAQAADAYTRAAYADFLLETGRAPEVTKFLAGETAADGLLLRLALAEQACGDARTADHIATLGARFAAARLRGENPHLREEARYALQLLRDAPRALSLARANWETQREPADALVLLQSALAAGKPADAAPVLAWMRDNGVEDVRLQGLARSLARISRTEVARVAR